MDKNKKTILKKTDGITLVALVVTIVILIILATVTINAVLGDSGLIKQAEKTKDIAGNFIAKENEDMNRLAQEYANMMAEDSNPPSPEDKTPPTVDIVVGEVTETSISVTVNATDDSGKIASYKYYLNGVEKTTSVTNSYTFIGLTSSTSYTIKVEALDKVGNKGENSITATTRKMTVEYARDNNIKFDNTTSLEDDSGDEVWIPGGFEVADDSAIDADDGIAIQDSKGNQFVWIPVLDYTTMYATGTYTLSGVTTQTSVYSKLRVRSEDSTYYRPTTPGNTSGSREPDLVTEYDLTSTYYSILARSAKEMADNMVSEYIATYNSIKKYKGFYIGRYEITGTVSSPTVKRGQTVLSNQNWYILKKACTNIVKSSYAQSTMVYGNQWDEIMSWLKNTKFKQQENKVDTDSSSWGNYNIDKKTSGYNDKWKANNIYDLAGNCYEWTQEALGTNDRIRRGRWLWEFRI